MKGKPMLRKAIFGLKRFEKNFRGYLSDLEDEGLLIHLMVFGFFYFIFVGILPILVLVAFGFLADYTTWWIFIIPFVGGLWVLFKDGQRRLAEAKRPSPYDYS